jgi:thiol-disulfide isomerase/thioredoxin
MDEVILRGLVALTLLIAGFAIFRMWTLRHRRHASFVAQRDPLLERVPPGVPAIVYFTTPTCIACRSAQTPALRQLQSELGDGIHVITVDAVDQPDAASRWGVLTAPTTFVLDPNHQTVAINHGTADSALLKRQYHAAVEAASSFRLRSSS